MDQYFILIRYRVTKFNPLKFKTILQLIRTKLNSDDNNRVVRMCIILTVEK